LCSNEDGNNPNAALVFEFLIYGENNSSKIEEEKVSKGNQVTVGWMSVPLETLLSN